MPLAMPLTVVQPGFVNVGGGAKRGSKATKRGEGVIPPSPPTVWRLLKIRVWKRHFLAHYWHRPNWLLLFFILFLMNLFQRNIFPFPPLLFYLVYSQINGGGGGGPFVHVPLCILAIPVTVVQPGFVIGGQSEGAKRPSGAGCGKPPSYGRGGFFFLKIRVWKQHFIAL